MEKDLEKTWDYDLMDLIKTAKNGNDQDMKNFVHQFSPFAVVNEDYTLFLVLRKFHVQYWKDERRVLNGKPEDKNFQRGITINTRDEDSGHETNIYLPNKFDYIGLELDGETIKIKTSQKIFETNRLELYRKLDFWGKFDETDIEKAFENINNEKYIIKPQKIIKPKSEKVFLKNIGELKYDETKNNFVGDFLTEKYNIDVILDFSTETKFSKLKKFVEKSICEDFFDNFFSQMEDEMINLKNETWLGEDESGNIEKPITKQVFRKRVKIEIINFFDDCCSQIYCSDDEIFFGHTILIDVDKNGKYQFVTLAG